MTEFGKCRQSNFELLRLVAIFMIIIHHLVIKSAATCGYTHPYILEQDGVMGVVINSFVVGGVNLFLLISGWFGVKKIFPQIIRLVLDCFIYSMITNAFCVLVWNYPFRLSEFFYSCNFLHNWFVSSFVMFVLMVPIIEIALKDIETKTLGKIVFLLTLANVVMGFCFGQYNTNGYNPFNFLYLYIIGRYLKQLSQNATIRSYLKYGVVVWIMCSLLLAVSFVMYAQHVKWTPSMSQRYFGYNNPFIVLSSVGIFAQFSLLKFQNAYVNKLAKGVFGIFLLHTTSIFIYYRSTSVGQYYKEYGYMSVFISACIIFIACSFVTLVFEKIKEPIYQYIYKKLE